MLVSLGVPDNKGPIRGVVRSLVNQVVPVSIIPSNIGNLGGLVENYPTMVGILSSLISLPSKWSRATSIASTSYRKGVKYILRTLTFMLQPI